MNIRIHDLPLPQPEALPVNQMKKGESIENEENDKGRKRSKFILDIAFDTDGDGRLT